MCSARKRRPQHHLKRTQRSLSLLACNLTGGRRMKPDNKQLPQLIVLGVLLLACIGYIGMKVVPKPAPAPAQSEANATAQAPAVEKSEAATKTVDGKTEAEQDPNQLANVNLM